jgi:hypothetical protein
MKKLNNFLLINYFLIFITCSPIPYPVLIALAKEKYLFFYYIRGKKSIDSKACSLKNGKIM